MLRPVDWQLGGIPAQGKHVGGLTLATVACA